MQLWQIKAVAAIILALFLFVAYQWVTVDAGNKAVAAYVAKQAEAQAKADKLTKDKYDNLEAELIVAKATRKTVYKTVTKTVDKIIDRPVYKTQCVDSEGLEAANKALSGGNANELF